MGEWSMGSGGHMCRWSRWSFCLSGQGERKQTESLALDGKRVLHTTAAASVSIQHPMTQAGMSQAAQPKYEPVGLK